MLGEGRAPALQPQELGDTDWVPPNGDNLVLVLVIGDNPPIVLLTTPLLVNGPEAKGRPEPAERKVNGEELVRSAETAFNDDEPSLRVCFNGRSLRAKGIGVLL